MKSKKTSAALLLLFLPLIICFAVFAFCYRSALMPHEHPMPVLMYHHVVSEGGDINGMTVTAEKLEKDLQYLAENDYTTVLPHELLEGNIPEKPVMITFDDGYRSNYELLFPLLQKYHMKAVISVITFMPDVYAQNYCTWDMLKEMSDSGLVELASHTYSLHNLDERGGEYEKGGVNGIGRNPGESDDDYLLRVTRDIGKSRISIQENTGADVCCFTYPYGESEPLAKKYVDYNYGVTFTTHRAIAELGEDFHDLPRVTVTMDTELDKVLYFVK